MGWWIGWTVFCFAAVFGLRRWMLADAPCLSIRQPWAELILLERKKVELRRWSTRYRGWTWLHTGKTVDEAARGRFGMPPLFSGGFVGVFRLRDVVGLDVELWDAWRPAHLDAGLYQPIFFGWVIGQAVRLRRPLAASGSQGLYRPEASILNLLLNEQFFGET
jgi:hypothetical protein